MNKQSTISVTLIVLLSITLLLSIVPIEAHASAGSYTLKWYAADSAVNHAPYLPTYAKITPAFSPLPPGTVGRQADPLANAVAYGPTSSSLDAVTSLAPQDMALGQIVPFEMVITVSGSTAPENGTIRFTTSFDTNTTGGHNFGFDPTYMVYAAFVDTADAGTIDPGNNAKVDSYTSTLTGSGSSQKIQGTFNVSGLNNGDRVVVEIWIVLKSTIPSTSSGNVLTNVVSAQTITGGTISAGVQTIPLLRVKEFFISNADVSITKADNPDPVIQGQNLTYYLIVKNNSPDTTANGIVVTDTLDLNTSFISASGAPYTISGNIVNFSVGSLSPGQSATITLNTQVNRTAWTNNDTSINSEEGTAGPAPTLYDLLDRVSETSITSDSNTANNVYYQPTNVLLAHPFYLIDKKVIDVAGKGPTGDVTAAGDVITYQVNVTNTGNIDLTNVTLNDSLINLTGPTESLSTDGILNKNEIWTYNGTYTVTQGDISSNGGGDGEINNTATVDCDQLDPKSHSAEVPIKANPAYIIDKIITDVAGEGPTGNITVVGDIISYQINVTNTGNVNLTNVTLNDSLIYLTGPSESLSTDGILNVGEFWTYNGSYTVTQVDIDSNGGGDGLINNTATVDCDQLDPKSHTAEVPLYTAPAYIIDKIIINVAGKGPTGYVTASGDVINYQINVTNAGNISLTNVTLNDSLINLTGPSESLSTDGILNVGEIWTYNGNYTVTQGDIDSNGGGDGLINNTATVDCNQLDPKSHSAEVPIKTPAYIINKIIIDVAGKGPTGQVTSVGDLINYQIDVTNVGDVNLTNVNVTDTLIVNLVGPTESINSNNILEVGETWTYTGNYTVTQEDIDNYGTPDEDIDTGGEGDIDNTATVDCDQLSPKSHSAEVPLGAPVYAIDKKVTDVAGKGPTGDVIEAGDIISYQIDISNIGNLDLTNINVSDSLINLTGPIGDNSPLGILNIGEIWTYTGNYTVTQTDINNTNSEGKGFINNTASVNSTQLAQINDSVTVPIVLPPAYTIDKIVIDVAGQGAAGNVTAAGDVISYQINAINSGKINLTNVTLNDTLINLTGPIESLNTDGILEVGENWTYNGTYIVNQTDISSYGGGNGYIENTATVNSDQLSPRSDSTEVPVSQIPALLTVKIASPTNYSYVGETITYTYNVTNTGNVNISAPINVTDNLTGTFTISTSVLPAGQSVIGTANYTITQSDLDNGSVVNAAYATGLFNNSTVASNITTATVFANQYPGLLTVKIASPTNYSYVGETITYTYNVTNTGNVNISAPINVTDNLTGTFTISTSVLPAGQSVIGTANYTITQSDLDNGSVVNAAYATGLFNNSTVASNITTATVFANQYPGLTIKKSAYPTTYSAVGQNITYTYEVTNTGNVIITGPINVNDNKIGTITLTNGNLAPEQTVTGTANYTITQSDLNNGSVTNSAYATGTYNGTIVNSNIDSKTVTASQGPCLTIIKSAFPKIYSAAGQVIIYTYIITNNGNATIAGPITVTDSKVGTITVTEGSLLPGQTVIGTASYTVTQSDLDNGSVTNAAFASGVLNGVKVVSNIDTATVTAIVQGPCYIINKEVTDVNGKGPFRCIAGVGDVITYKIEVINTGNVDLTNVQLYDTLINLVGPVESLNTNGILEVGETWTYTGTYTVTLEDMISNGGGNGFICNTATVTSDQLGPQSSSAAVPIKKIEILPEIKPAYCICKSIVGADEKGDCIINAPKDIIQYRVVVKNVGNVDLTGVFINDPMITLKGPIGDDVDPGVLNQGETWVYNGDYVLTQDDLNNKEYLKNTATVFSNELPPSSSCVSQPINKKANLQIQISTIGIDESGNKVIDEPGDIINYQVAVKNTGDITLTGVSVRDPTVNFTESKRDDEESGVLKPGDIYLYEGDYIVTQADIDNTLGIITNTVNVSCDQLSDESSSIDLPITYTSSISATPVSENTTILPVVDFIANVTNGYTPLSVQFTDLSQNGTSRSWDFDNDGISDSSDANPVYTYTSPGIYTVNLTIGNIIGSVFNTTTINVQQKSSSSGSSQSSHSSGGNIRTSNIRISGADNNNLTVNTNATASMKKPGDNNSNLDLAAVDQTLKQKSTGNPESSSSKTPGFEIISEITALLAVYLYRKK